MCINRKEILKHVAILSLSKHTHVTVLKTSQPKLTVTNYRLLAAVSYTWLKQIWLTTSLSGGSES